ncbi:hypothetical protein L9F63_010516, partial [Diploptera punctata]
PELVARIVAAAAEIREHPDMLLRVHQSVMFPTTTRKCCTHFALVENADIPIPTFP